MPKKITVKPSAQKKATPKEADEAAKEARKRPTKQAQILRGMKDVLPKDERYWSALAKKAEEVAHSFGFRRIRTPALEEASLFVRAVGKGTDIVDKEMYVFEDLDGTRVALRPEFTAGICRAFIAHGMHVDPQPVKLFTMGPLYRHERPQTGRFREHHQIDFELFGDPKPVADAEMILAAWSILMDFGLAVEVRVNSIGTAEDRMRYKLELVNYYRGKRGYLCDDCKRRLTRNPLRLLDCKKEQCQPIKEEAPQILDWLSEPSKSHFMKVLENLEEAGIPYTLDSCLVRGLDYYNYTLFEIYAAGSTDAGKENETSQSALAGGGRYDGLVEALGGVPTPAVGFGMGMERVVLELKAQAIAPPPLYAAPLFLAQLGEQASRRALKLLQEMRTAGLHTYHNFGKTGLKAQLELANQYRVPMTVIIGQKEVVDGTAIVRDMESGIQEIIDERQLIAWLQKKCRALDKDKISVALDEVEEAESGRREASKAEAAEEVEAPHADAAPEEEDEEKKAEEQ